MTSLPLDTPEQATGPALHSPPSPDPWLCLLSGLCLCSFDWSFGPTHSFSKHVLRGRPEPNTVPQAGDAHVSK